MVLLGTVGQGHEELIRQMCAGGYTIDGQMVRCSVEKAGRAGVPILFKMFHLIKLNSRIVSSIFCCINNQEIMKEEMI